MASVSGPTIDAYPTQFDAWAAAGGVDDAFKAYMLGTKQIAAQESDVPWMIGQMGAKMNEAKGISEQLLGIK